MENVFKNGKKGSNKKKGHKRQKNKKMQQGIKKYTLTHLSALCACLNSIDHKKISSKKRLYSK